MNIKNLKEKKLKKKGEIIMINRINKKSIIILLFVMLFTILVPKDVNAATYNINNVENVSIKNADFVTSRDGILRKTY